jgi:hypothetical protein
MHFEREFFPIMLLHGNLNNKWQKQIGNTKLNFSNKVKKKQKQIHTGKVTSCSTSGRFLSTMSGLAAVKLSGSAQTTTKVAKSLGH